jgi:signal transduction histidine kinase
MNSERVFLHDMKNLLGIIIGYSNLLLDTMPEGDPHRDEVDEIRLAGEGAIALLTRWSEASSASAREDAR